jgi:hypothetical protein
VVNVTGQSVGIATDLYVSNIVTGTQSAGQGNKNGTATVTILDNNANPVTNASITGTFSGTFSETISGSTSSNGSVTLVTTGQAKGSVTVDLCVDNVTHGSLTYNNSLNVITCTGGGSARLSENLEADEVQEVIETLKSGIKIYPNPFRSEFKVEISLDISTAFKASIMSLDGKIIKTLTADDLAEGMHTIKVDLRNFEAGLYFLQTEMNGQKDIQRLLKIN